MLENLRGLKKVLEVFSKEYKKETEYREFMESNLDRMKIKLTADDIEKKIKVLKNNNYKSNFKIKIGSYE